jgi:hypothetical protein
MQQHPTLMSPGDVDHMHRELVARHEDYLAHVDRTQDRLADQHRQWLEGFQKRATNRFPRRKPEAEQPAAPEKSVLQHINEWQRNNDFHEMPSASGHRQLFHAFGGRVITPSLKKALATGSRYHHGIDFPPSPIWQSIVDYQQRQLRGEE